MLRAVRVIFWGPGPSDRYHDLTDANGTEWVALVVLGACIVIFGVAPDLILQFVDVSTVEYLAPVLDALTDAGGAP